MFESDADWDLDEDFLDDIDEKATQYYSQNEGTTADESAKKRKIDEGHCSTSKSNVKEDSAGLGSENTSALDPNRKSRTNLVLGILSGTSTKKPEPIVNNDWLRGQSGNKDVSKSICSQTKDKGDDKTTRKNLVLGILQNKDVTVHQKTESSLRDRNKKNALSSTVNNNREVKTSKNLASKIQHTITNHEKKVPEKTVVSVEKTNPKPSGNDTLRKQMVLDLLKQYPPKKKSEKTVVKLVQASERVALVRKFPGPAGLLPDKLDGCVPPVSYWNSIEETEKNRSTESSLSEFCSQNTKNLFTEGAWQNMLDDLPADFLKDYNIASMKHKANRNDNRSTKVKFLAGIVECIDHNHDNPPIILKDFTDSIQGIVHRDIKLEYPGLLEPNVVLLLHDVGVLRISGSLLSSKYHILISPSSLLGIYSNKGDIVHTSHMKTLFGNDVRENVKQSKSFNSSKQQTKTKPNLNKLLTTKSSAGDNTLSKEILELANELDNFDDENDFSFCVSSTEITNSQNQKHFANSSASENRDSKKTESMVQSLKKLSSAIKDKKDIVTVRKSGSDDEHPNSIKNLTEKPLSISDFDLSEVDLDDTIRDVPEKPQTNAEANIKRDIAKGKSSVRSKLLQFRSNDVLTPPPSKDTASPTVTPSSADHTKESTEEMPISTGSSRFEGLLSNTANDSDDEMLSQIDVDIIFSNYGKSQ